jgi:hypothetical protein
MTQSANPSLWRTLFPAMLGGSELPDAETIKAYKIAAADPNVVRLIGACTSELVRLVTEGGAEHMMHAAVQGAALGDITPAQWLENQLGMFRSEIELVRKERKLTADRRRAEVVSLKRLSDAVQRFTMKASAERDALMARVRSAELGGEQPSRWTELRAAGLTDEEIRRVGLPLDRDAQVKAWRDQLAMLDQRLAKCAAFRADPLRDPEHVRGLGFDDLIDGYANQNTVSA